MIIQFKNHLPFFSFPAKLFFLSFCLFGCIEDKQQTKLVVDDVHLLDSIPSGSGIALKSDDSVFIIGDDATELYLLNLKNYRYQKIALTGMNLGDHRESREVKRDLESATLINWNGKKYLIAFGSGSKPVIRDSLLLINVSDNEEQKITSLHEFYLRLQKIIHADSTQWNIEGSAVVNDNLVLCNRGNNVIISMSVKSFMDYLSSSPSPFPKVTFQKIKLPAINGKEARLSGACRLDDSHILFSASVEDTPDWTKDGPVLGSFIGSYNLNSKTVDACYLLQEPTGEPMKEKIESLDILHGQKSEAISIVAVSDDDNGYSKLFQLRILK